MVYLVKRMFQQKLEQSVAQLLKTKFFHICSLAVARLHSIDLRLQIFSNFLTRFLKSKNSLRCPDFRNYQLLFN